MSESTLPVVVLCSYPIPGHTNPLITICQRLASSGFPCFFLIGDAFRDRILGLGAEPHSLPPLVANATKKEFAAIPSAMESFYYAVRHFFIDAAPKYSELLGTLLVHVKERYPQRNVVIIHDSWFLGAMPFQLGTPLPKGYDRFPNVIGISPAALTWQGKDTPPFGLGLSFDPSEEGRQNNMRLAKELEGAPLETTRYADDLFKRMGTTKDLQGWFGSRMMDVPDATLMLCSPSLEYPQSDLSPKVHFIGGIPLSNPPDNYAYAEWWPEIESNSKLSRKDPKRKKVVFVSQGTIVLDSSELIHPTIHGLATREDIILVVTLGKVGKQLGFDLPALSNARVIDYLPYGLILPFADVFVSNAGYGGLMHGVMNGVPMVLAGVVADKGETCARGEWAGVGVNLKTQTPSPEMVAEAVNTVLGDGAYRTRALELRKENESMDCLAKIEQTVLQMAA